MPARRRGRWLSVYRFPAKIRTTLCSSKVEPLTDNQVVPVRVRPKYRLNKALGKGLGLGFDSPFRRFGVTTEIPAPAGDCRGDDGDSAEPCGSAGHERRDGGGRKMPAARQEVAWRAFFRRLSEQ